MERLEANTIPVEGTIYYEDDNMETLYVAQAIDDNEQYQYDNTTMDQDEQMSWEVANPEANQNQEEDSSQVYNIRKVHQDVAIARCIILFVFSGSNIFTRG